MKAEPVAGRTVGPISGSFVLVEWTDEGGGHDPPWYIAPLHVHHADDEAWYVLEGTLRFRIGDEEIEAPAGAAVVGPRGVPHTYWNPSPEPARYLLILTPNTLALIDQIHALEDRSPEAVREVFERHDSSLVD